MARFGPFRSRRERPWTIRVSRNALSACLTARLFCRTHPSGAPRSAWRAPEGARRVCEVRRRHRIYQPRDEDWIGFYDCEPRRTWCVCVCVCVCCVCVQTCVCVGVCVCSVSICAALTYMLLGAPGGAVSRRAGGPGSGAAVAVTVGHRVAVSFRLPVSREFAVLMSEVNIYIRYPES